MFALPNHKLDIPPLKIMNCNGKQEQLSSSNANNVKISYNFLITQ
jgi:hypothetical protein